MIDEGHLDLSKNGCSIMKKIGENILVPLQSALKFVAVAGPPRRKHRYSKYTVSCFCISDLFNKLLSSFTAVLW